MVGHDKSYSQGWGDGERAEIVDGIFEVESSPNTTHLHLPGDFMRRKVGGELILMKRDKFENLQSAVVWLEAYWASCNPKQFDLDDYQIAELSTRMESLVKMVGK